MHDHLYLFTVLAKFVSCILLGWQGCLYCRTLSATSSSAHAPEAPEPSQVDAVEGGADEVVARAAEALADVAEPSAAERAKHELTHLPY